MITSSTLVETVSINCEDFTEGFLTCSTCLNTYDNGDHCPKLLSCSHTICRFCLEKICNLPGVSESGSFLCPICREEIQLPRDGVSSFPPSFIVNQLLDLISQQRREVVPKCSNHLTRELLFCETCDCVFCSLCNNGSHVNIDNCEHTVIPFSIAIKRMSEILLYKAHQCIGRLNEAKENVMNEMRKLDSNSERAFENINRSFQEIINIVDRRRQEVLAMAKKMKEEKHSVLESQLNLIEAEKSKVKSECDRLQYQVDVRNITSKITELSDKMESIGLLQDPRENCFISYEYLYNGAARNIKTAIDNFGAMRTSSTFPPYCTASIGPCSANLLARAEIITYDVEGLRRYCCGDPIAAELKNLEDGTDVDVYVVSNEDGTYFAEFVPPKGGRYHLLITIFDRPIKNYPLEFEASSHINPCMVLGGKGSKETEFNQPTGITIDSRNGDIYILDTGNERIKVLNLRSACDSKNVDSVNSRHNSNHTDCVTIDGDNSEYSIRHINGIDRRVTGIALIKSSGNILVANWQTCKIEEIDGSGNIVRSFSHKDFGAPTHLTVNSVGEIIVADNDARAVFILHPSGKLYQKLECPGNSGKNGSNPCYNEQSPFDVVGAVGIGADNDILIADSVIHVYSRSGIRKREIHPEGRLRGVYSGIAYDGDGNLLAIRTDYPRGKKYLQVFDYPSGKLKFCIDSNDSKLKRPVSIATTKDHRAIVVDLGTDCIKMYKYE